MTMRAGAIISAIAHAGLIVWVLLTAPKPFETASGEAVAVDLVTPEELQAETPPKPEREVEPDKPLVIPPRPDAVTAKTASLPEPPSTPPKAAAPPAKARARAAPQQPPAAQPQQQPAAQRGAAAPASPPPAPSPAAPTDTPPSIFDPASIPKLQEIAPPPTPATVAAGGFDAPADSRADLAREEVATFKTHLRRCLRLPAGVDAEQPLRIVVRVFLTRSGALAADPMLVSAPAVQEGPSLVQAATKALKACQPYALPAEKYDEWKMIDLSLSPRDMTGG